MLYTTQDTRELWVAGGKPQERFISKMFLRGDSVIIVLAVPE